nr:MAG TPA: hypothetical protein [Caudoviricetes sp.]
MPATDEEYKPYLDSPTKAIRLVSEYTLLSFNDVVELDCYTFKVLVRDAFVDKMS